MLIDSHCHIPMIEASGGCAEVIAAALAGGVGHMLCVSVDLETCPEVMRLAEQYACVSATVGVHPNSRIEVEPSVTQLTGLAGNPNVVAIGETGLDYFRSQGELAWQRERFRNHIRAAIAVSKPLVIHSREAREDVLAIMREESADRVGGVMHCFTDDWETASRAIELNFYISFSGIVTFKTAEALKDVARLVPLDRLLIETDAPYLAPVPYRGKQNQPAYVRYVAEYIAQLKGVSVATIAAATSENFRNLFKYAEVG